jgi:hypothetical protein
LKAKRFQIWGKGAPAFLQDAISSAYDPVAAGLFSTLGRNIGSINDSLKKKFETELQQTGWSGIQNAPKVRRCQISHWYSEIRVIRNVKTLGTKLKLPRVRPTKALE